MRFFLAITFFFGVGIQYTHKTDISVAIVCMVNHTALQPNKTQFYLDDFYSDNYDTCYFHNNGTGAKDKVN